jgi:uncharacterized protein YdeI (YjbR/CyaY-like superfamily)
MAGQAGRRRRRLTSNVRVHANALSSLPKNAIHPKTRAAWRRWLREHHNQTKGIWFVSYKKATGNPRVEYEEAVEEALCFGWVDSKVNKLDEERSMLWFSPRKANTGGSKPNKERIERILAAGLMHSIGLAKVKQAKADGSWSSLDRVEALLLPTDLKIAFARVPECIYQFREFSQVGQAWHPRMDNCCKASGNPHCAHCRDGPPCQ